METQESSESVFIADKADQNYGYNCRNDIVSAIIPDGVTSVGEAAFMYCSGLKSITLPDSVTSLGRAAFSECRSLKSVSIPGSAACIGREAFAFCGSLKSVALPDSVVRICVYAFAFCGSLRHIELPAGIRFIDAEAFRESGLECADIPDGIIAVHSEAFCGCEDLKSITWRGKVYDSIKAFNRAVSEASAILSPIGPMRRRLTAGAV
ncbi:leucine-rich repeat protein [bacterium]|nr:leucine-rich repeat protein [bacterium]